MFDLSTALEAAPAGSRATLATQWRTLAFLETLLVGIATQRPKETIGSLTKLNQIRADVTGRALEL
ncbi:hypothetical protein GCM10011505_49730 [Tistrella bauzanensis]|uniref:Uncharacterized protein n=1 Tax=Tistrella bauzanensis TaxID=657419 RepID=A0ABQ1JCR8_9PROT|nr:hypothetical protein GCM10011505_49730 [Tistrella bauzanensis]